MTSNIMTAKRQDTERKNCTNNIRGQNKPYMVLPYVMGLSESMKNISNKHRVQVHYKGGNTIKGLLMTPKDKGQITMKSGIIYRFKCQRVDSDDEYIGESSRSFGERFREHQKAPSQMYDHHIITGHDTTIPNFSIVGREDQNVTRAIRKLFTSGWTIHPFIEIQASTICLTYGMGFWITSLNWNCSKVTLVA